MTEKLQPITGYVMSTCALQMLCLDLTQAHHTHFARVPSTKRFEAVVKPSMVSLAVTFITHSYVEWFTILQGHMHTPFKQSFSSASASKWHRRMREL